MSFTGLIRTLRNRIIEWRFRRKGQGLWDEYAARIEDDWKDVVLTSTRYSDPESLKGLFFGWMYRIHAELEEVYALIELPVAGAELHWASVAGKFGNRFRTEMLPPEQRETASEVLSDEEIRRLATDIHALVDDFQQACRQRLEEALDEGVSAVRRGEKAGRVSPDPRSDEKLKESIRRMWTEDSDSDRA